MPTTARTRADACPGVVSPHLAADGALARVRLPGGVLAAPALRVVATLAEAAGDGSVHLTSRGNLQLRGLDPADPRPVQLLGAAGLLPSTTHERVRNILASPLSGITGGLADLRGSAAALDRGLCARPGLARLSGRFLFALDDGRGDVAGERPDVCWRATGADDGELLVAGTGTGLRCSRAGAPALLLDAAEAFLTLDAGTWRAAELDDAPTRIGAILRRRATPGDGPPAAPGDEPAAVGSPGDRPTVDGAPGDGSPGDGAPALGSPGDRPSGVGDLGGGALGVAPVLGELSSAQLAALAGAAPELIVTPWRTLVLPRPAADAPARLRAAGLVTDPDHPALRVSACAGAPGCAKSLADVRADARELIRHGTGRPVHVVGCARRCGAPHTPHVDAVATGPGSYRLDGEPGTLVAPSQDRPRSIR
ncbi:MULTISPECIES: nitrite/sulfite reductase [Pseudonocardia]|uniref:nitrite/sulfite reductase n=1 Tax=Pseudonocardia TaxID=1847 RepID=UPI000A280CFA|nr:MULTISPECIES: nitrite/sulfite reductase [Pseudonocardia]